MTTMAEALKDLEQRVSALESADGSINFLRSGATVSSQQSSQHENMIKIPDAWMEQVSSTLQQMQEKDDSLAEDLVRLERDIAIKGQSQPKETVSIMLLDAKVDHVVWQKANDELDLMVRSARESVSSLRRDVDSRRRKVDEVLATLRHDITALETNLTKCKVKASSDTEQAVKTLNGRIDLTNKDVVTTQETLQTTQKSVSDCFSEVAVVRCDSKRLVADSEARLKNEIQGKQQEILEKMGVVEQQADLRCAEASRHLASLDARVSNQTKNISENKRDVLKLREELNGLLLKCASYEVDIEKSSDAVRKIGNQNNIGEQSWKEQIDSLHSILETKANARAVEDLQDSTASLTKGVVKVAQVIGVYPKLTLDDTRTGDQLVNDLEKLDWQECAANMAFRVDKAWQQRFPQQFKNIIDMVAVQLARKPDQNVLRLDTVRASKAQRERKVWKEVVERRCNSVASMHTGSPNSTSLPAMSHPLRGNASVCTPHRADADQPLQLALLMNDAAPSHSVTLPAMPHSARG